MRCVPAWSLVYENTSYVHWRQRTSNIGGPPLFFSPSFLPLPSLPSLFPTSPLLNSARECGKAIPVGPGGAATKRNLVHLEVKMKRFRGQISCIFNRQNLFYDSNHKINKKLSYCRETVRRESMPRIAEMDVEMTTYAEMTFKCTSRSSKVAPIESWCMVSY